MDLLKWLPVAARNRSRKDFAPAWRTYGGLGAGHRRGPPVHRAQTATCIRVRWKRSDGERRRSYLIKIQGSRYPVIYQEHLLLENEERRVSVSRDRQLV